MKILDANVLLYAVDELSARHDSAHRWLEGALSREEVVGFAWIVMLGFVRLSTLPSAFPSPLSPTDALGHLERWLAEPPAVVVHPTTRHLAVLRGLLEPIGTGGNLTNDAHLAALAVEHGADIVSFDRDFDRFAGVRWIDPAAL